MPRASPRSPRVHLHHGIAKPGVPAAIGQRPAVSDGQSLAIAGSAQADMPQSPRSVPGRQGRVVAFPDVSGRCVRALAPGSTARTSGERPLGRGAERGGQSWDGSSRKADMPQLSRRWRSCSPWVAAPPTRRPGHKSGHQERWRQARRHPQGRRQLGKVANGRPQEGDFKAGQLPAGATGPAGPTPRARRAGTRGEVLRCRGCGRYGAALQWRSQRQQVRDRAVPRHVPGQRRGLRGSRLYRCDHGGKQRSGRRRGRHRQPRPRHRRDDRGDLQRDGRR